jgi:erythromycin esterase-like protein
LFYPCSEKKELAVTVEKRIVLPSDELAAQLRAASEPLPNPDAPEFAVAFDRFGDAHVVLLGEATHGTHEFYAARAAITCRLVERHWLHHPCD